MFSVYRTDQLKRFALFWLLNYSFIFSLDVKVWIRFIYCISSDFTLFSFICLELCFKKAQRPVIILLFFQFPTVFLPVISKTKIFPKALLGIKGNKYYITDQLFLTNVINTGYSTYVEQIDFFFVTFQCLFKFWWNCFCYYWIFF